MYNRGDFVLFSDLWNDTGHIANNSKRRMHHGT